MNKIVECIPNFSEGRNQEVMDAIIKATKMDGVNLLDINIDENYNRMVLTLVGEPDAVIQSVFNATAKATELIDMNKHSGQHPRIGATDVAPFIPISNITIEECIELANELAQKISSELDIPVYMYELAAKVPERHKLQYVRRGNYEGLKDEIENTDRLPDYGQAKLHPTAGAMAIGVRNALIAFNIKLGTDDVSIAKRISNTFREAKGGFKDARAMGVSIKDKNIVEVSTMVNNDILPLFRMVEMVRSEASRYGVSIVGTEIIGLIPRKALIDAAEFYLQIDDFDNKQILEENL